MKKSIVGLHRVALLHAFRRVEGFMYRAPILVNGDTGDEPQRSKLVLFEDGYPMRRAHEQHSTIAGTGRGAYSHWESHILFSASDNSDPNSNGRTYSYAIDHTGQHELQDDFTVALHSPFHPHGGLCWGVTVLDEGDHGGAPTASRLTLFEDGRSIGPPHAAHSDIERTGGGTYSHWKTYLYFSTSDGSDPNTNGRLYSYEIDG